jgi:hypothetical protein
VGLLLDCARLAEGSGEVTLGVLTSTPIDEGRSIADHNFYHVLCIRHPFARMRVGIVLW